MRQIEFDAFQSTFGFAQLASTTHDAKDCNSIKVLPITKALLMKTPEDNSATGSMVDISSQEQISFCMGEVQEVNAVRGEGYTTFANEHEEDIYTEGELIIDAIIRLKIQDNIDYVLLHRSGHKIRNHASTEDWELEVYFLGNFNLRKFAYEQVKEAHEKYRAMLVS